MRGYFICLIFLGLANCVSKDVGLRVPAGQMKKGTGNIGSSETSKFPSEMFQLEEICEDLSTVQNLPSSVLERCRNLKKERSRRESIAAERDKVERILMSKLAKSVKSNAENISYIGHEIKDRDLKISPDFESTSCYIDSRTDNSQPFLVCAVPVGVGKLSECSYDSCREFSGNRFLVFLVGKDGAIIRKWVP